jgi:hypothetical protein
MLRVSFCPTRNLKATVNTELFFARRLTPTQPTFLALVLFKLESLSLCTVPLRQNS